MPAASLVPLRILSPVLLRNTARSGGIQYCHFYRIAHLTPTGDLRQSAVAAHADIIIIQATISDTGRFNNRHKITAAFTVQIQTLILLFDPLVIINFFVTNDKFGAYHKGNNFIGSSVIQFG